MLQVIFALCFLTLTLLIYGIFKWLFIKNEDITDRLSRLSGSFDKAENNELNQSLFVRIIKPTINEISKVFMRITPKEVVSGLEKKVNLAGYPYKMGVKEWVNIQVGMVLFLPVATIGIGILMGMPFKNLFFAVAAEVMAGIAIPGFVLGSKITERQKRITNSMPDVLDLLTVSVEAGLGFDAALSKVIEKFPGELAQEFARVLQEMKMGRNKKEALKSMSDRLSVPDLTSFITSIIQADQFGVSIGNVLRMQADQMREKRKQRANEKAMKAPIKMLIPMVLFIFPTLFSVLLGPIAIKIFHAFAK